MKKSLSGNEAVAYGMKQLNPDVIAAYPITPSTTIPEKISEYVNNGEMDTEFINVESEHSAMAASIGASLSGARAMTATSSNGLMYMFEMLHIASGLRSSVVLALATRAISAPLNIHNDHSDAMQMRDSGFIMLFSEDNQEVYDNLIIATKLAEDKRVLLPVAAIQDGYITSHKETNMEVLDDDIVKSFAGEYKRDINLLDKKNPVTIGTIDLPPYLFEHKRGEIEAFNNSKNILKEIDKEFEKISGRKYEFFEEYKTEDADSIIICMGSSAGTVKDVIDELRKKGKKVGLIKIRLYRPFPKEEILDTISKKENLKNIAVLDKTMPFSGFGGPLYLDVSSSIYDLDKRYNLIGYTYGIGGRDFKPEYVNEVFEDLEKIDENKKDEKIKKFRYLGLRGEN